MLGLSECYSRPRVGGIQPLSPGRVHDRHKERLGRLFRQSSGRSRVASVAKQATVHYINIIVKIVDLIEKKTNIRVSRLTIIVQGEVFFMVNALYSVCSQRQAIIPCCLDVSHFVCFNSARQKASIR